MKSFIDDLKVYLLNSGVLMISFTKVENVLKIILLITSIAYTLVRLRQSLKKNKDETDT